MRHALLLRAALVAAVAAAVLVPVALVKGQVAERSARAHGVVAQFATETAGPQVVAGPLLALTCEETYAEEREVMRGGKAETVSETKVRACPTTFVAPRALEVEANVPVEARHRGIYPIRLYRAKLRLAGEIAWPAPAPAEGPLRRAWRRAYLVMAVADARGIRELRATPPATQARAEAIDPRFTYRSDLGEYADARAGEVLAFDVALELVGTSRLAIAPVGDTTRIALASSWPHPSFSGHWSPDERRIGARGFEARWQVTHHATGGQAAWEREARAGSLFHTAAVAGVALLDPVDVYALSHRATEYGFLFVLFTFGALALTEALARVRLHPAQYLLVGCALAVFFLLLLAGSEHVAFGTAYLASATACVALLGFYLRHPLGSGRRAAAFVALFAGMYAALFALLKSEDHALLAGSLLVFLLLAVAMVATRRLDWSAISRGMAAAPANGLAGHRSNAP